MHHVFHMHTMPVDFFGDYLYNKAHHAGGPTTASCLAAWADAMRHARPGQRAGRAHGDKEKPEAELTRQYNEG